MTTSANESTKMISSANHSLEPADLSLVSLIRVRYPDLDPDLEPVHLVGVLALVLDPVQLVAPGPGPGPGPPRRVLDLVLYPVHLVGPGPSPGLGPPLGDLAHPGQGLNMGSVALSDGPRPLGPEPGAV
ncbi:unnamed protein product [Gadus morhua 'NCC']